MTFDDRWNENRAYWYARGYRDARELGVKDWSESHPPESHYFYDKGFDTGMDDEREGFT